MPLARAPRGPVRPGEVVRDRTRTADPAVTNESTVDLLRARTVGRGLDRAPGRTREVVAVVGPEIGVTTARGSSDRTITAALTTSRDSKGSTTRTIVAAVTISRIAIDSTTISTTIDSATDAAEVSTIAAAVAGAAATVVADSSTVSRASAISGTGGTSGTVGPPLATGTAIVVTRLIR